MKQSSIYCLAVGALSILTLALTGAFFHAHAQSEDRSIAEQSSSLFYRDESLGLFFGYPDNWQLQESGWPDLEGGSEKVLTSDEFGIISLTSETSLLKPEQWFTNNRHQFHAEHIREAGSFLVGGEPAIILYQPDTCETAAMLYAIFEHENHLFKLMYLATGREISVGAFETILQSVTFNNAPKTRTSLSDISTLDFNAIQLETTPCGEERRQEWTEEVASARYCSNAHMYIPTEGTLVAPWACWNAPVCPMYNPNASDEYFRSPHRGIDIAGGQGAGVTPVYATYSGIVYLYQQSSIRLLFDAPFDYLSAYHAHMAAENPYNDFRTVVNGQRVQGGVTQLGTQGFYGLGSASNTHLHISYHNRNTGETPWPTYDPTQFLNAEHLVFYPGWQVEGSIKCPPDSCCGCGSSVAGFEGVGLTGSNEVYGPPSPPEVAVSDFPASDGLPAPLEQRRMEGTVVASVWPTLAWSTVASNASFSGPAEIESTPVPAAVRLDLDTAPPSSANYRLARSVMGMGGGVKSSSSYVLRWTIGQPFATGPRTSSTYRLNSGYWGAPITTPTPMDTPTPTATLPPGFDYNLDLPVVINGN